MLAWFLCGEFLLLILSWLHFFYFFYFFKSGEFLLHIPCWIYFSVGSFYYTSHAGFIFLWGVSLTHPVLDFFFFLFLSREKHPVLASFVFGEFLLHIPCWLHFYLGSFSYTSHAGFIFMLWVSLTHPELASFPFLCGEFLLHIPCWLLFSFLVWEVSLTYPVLASFLSGEFLLHIPYWL